MGDVLTAPARGDEQQENASVCFCRQVPMSTNVSNRERRARRTAIDVADFQSPALSLSAEARDSTPWERWLLRRAIAAVGNPAITIVLWDGQEVSGPAAGGEDRNTRLKVNDRRALWGLLWDPWFQFGELYARGGLEVEGNRLEDFLRTTYVARPKQPPGLLSRWWQWLRRRRNSLSGSRENIHHHYDIGNEFYKLWLDERLIYTCAYYADPTLSLSEAQVAKLDHVCRKLGLVRGQRVVEAGCGWGALALHMASHYDVSVTAYNISREQIAHARQEAQRQGLSGKVEFIEADWRTARGPCDAFVSVGMLEHVGRENYRQLGTVIDRCLTPGGRGLIHSIGQNQPGPTSTWIERRVFPGAYPPALCEMLDVIQPHGFSVLDVENLRLHYAQTLRHWLERFDVQVDAVRQMYGEPFVRLWRLYLCGSMVAFQTGGLQLFQVVFAREDNNRIPWTREGLYSADGEVPAW
jgi:cyclopropane-fatty-acyl-phospholipid synthase